MSEEPLKMDVPTKIILCVLEATPERKIRGRTFFVHQVFLVTQEVCPDAAHYFEWYPYQYGPYSTVFAKRMNKLQAVGYIKAEPVKGVWTYSITPDGRDFLSTHLLDEGEVYDLWEVQRIDGWDEGLGEMIDFAMTCERKKFKNWLREKYPQYFSRER